MTRLLAACLQLALGLIALLHARDGAQKQQQQQLENLKSSRGRMENSIEPHTLLQNLCLCCVQGVCRGAASLLHSSSVRICTGGNSFYQTTQLLLGRCSRCYWRRRCLCASACPAKGVCPASAFYTIQYLENSLRSVHTGCFFFPHAGLV